MKLQDQPPAYFIPQGKPRAWALSTNGAAYTLIKNTHRKARARPWPPGAGDTTMFMHPAIANRLWHSFYYHAWKDTLTSGQRADWTTAATHLTIKNNDGRVKTPNGMQLFLWWHSYDANFAWQPPYPPYLYPGNVLTTPPDTTLPVPTLGAIRLNTSTPPYFQIGFTCDQDASEMYAFLQLTRATTTGSTPPGHRWYRTRTIHNTSRSTEPLRPESQRQLPSTAVGRNPQLQPHSMVLNQPLRHRPRSWRKLIHHRRHQLTEANNHMPVAMGTNRALRGLHDMGSTKRWHKVWARDRNNRERNGVDRKVSRMGSRNNATLPKLRAQPKPRTERNLHRRTHRSKHHHIERTNNLGDNRHRQTRRGRYRTRRHQLPHRMVRIQRTPPSNQFTADFDYQAIIENPASGGTARRTPHARRPRHRRPAALAVDWFYHRTLKTSKTNKTK